MKTSEPGFLFWCFLVSFPKFLRTQLFTEQHLMTACIIAVSIVATGALANETVNYDTKTKAYILI